MAFGRYCVKCFKQIPNVSEALRADEYAYNAYPFCKTVIENREYFNEAFQVNSVSQSVIHFCQPYPYIYFKSIYDTELPANIHQSVSLYLFQIEISSYHIPDMGTSDNIFELDESELKIRFDLKIVDIIKT